VIAMTMSRRAQAAVCRVDGDLDAFGVSRYREVTASLAGSSSALVIDLSGVGFIDGAGLGALVGTIRRCRDQDRPVVVCSPRPSVARALEAAGFERFASLAATVPEALAALDALDGLNEVDGTAASQPLGLPF